MSESQPKRHSFVIRIWLEESAKEATEPIWRGSVTHIPTNTQGYFQDMSELGLFIQRYIWEKGKIANNTLGNQGQLH